MATQQYVEQPMDSSYFRVAGKLASLLGEQSVSNSKVALIELIKNSYDADATSVLIKFENIRSGSGKITITDNGSGMDHNKLTNDWMRIATTDKERNQYTPKKRRKIGEKGIGRFAIQKLSLKTEIVSRPEKNEEGYRLQFDWKKFEEGNTDIDKVPVPSYKFQKATNDHGLTITLDPLKEKWNEDTIKEVVRDISLIIPPQTNGMKFNVKVLAEEFPKYSGKIKSSFFKQADYTFSGKLEKNGKITYRLRSANGKSLKETDTLKEFTCGPIEFDIFFFYLGKTDYAPWHKQDRDYKSIKTMLEEFSGVKLYRDNFRVKPFGDPGNDWLGLNQDRVQNPTLYPSNNQIIGFVKISKERNPNLVDTTTREGMMGNAAYKDLVNFIKNSLKYFSIKRGELEGKRRGRPKGSKSKASKTAIKTAFGKKAAISDLIPASVAGMLPAELQTTIYEINGSNQHGFFNSCAVMMRKAIETATILKFKQEGKEDTIKVSGEYVGLGKRLELAKQNGWISTYNFKKISVIELFGDNAAHSYRIKIREDDIPDIAKPLRLALEDMQLDKKKKADSGK